MNEKMIAILEKLIAVCKDAGEGYQLAANEVSASSLQALFQGYSFQRLRFATELETAASALEKKASAGDSSAGRTWMAPGDGAAARDEQAVLAECERGESAAVVAYTLALEEPELPPAIRAMITAQAASVKEAHTEVCNRRNRFAPAAQP